MANYWLICQSYEQRLKAFSLLPISYWHEYLDMLLFSKITHGLVDIDPKIAPIARSTRHTIVCQYSCYQILCTHMFFSSKMMIN